MCAPCGGFTPATPPPGSRGPTLSPPLPSPALAELPAHNESLLRLLTSYSKALVAPAPAKAAMLFPMLPVCLGNHIVLILFYRFAGGRRLPQYLYDSFSAASRRSQTHLRHFPFNLRPFPFKFDHSKSRFCIFIVRVYFQGRRVVGLCFIPVLFFIYASPRAE